MKNPWIKLYRTVLNDEKISFIIRRYGHECLTFWIGLLTKCEDGILLMDEEIFADLCLLETKRYEEIRDVFQKRGLIEIDPEGHITVIHWADYQGGESTDRVRKYRDSQKTPAKEPEIVAECNDDVTECNGDETIGNADETVCNASETFCNGDETFCNGHETEMKRLEGEGELEGDEEEEGEGERARAKSPAPGVYDPGGGRAATAAAVVEDWFETLSQEIWVKVTPPPKAQEWAASVISAARGELAQVRRFREEYFKHWRELWFAVGKGELKKEAGKRAPDFDFRAYCANIATLAARIHVSEKKNTQTVYSSSRLSLPSIQERMEAGMIIEKKMKLLQFL